MQVFPFSISNFNFKDRLYNKKYSNRILLLLLHTPSSPPFWERCDTFLSQGVNDSCRTYEPVLPKYVCLTVSSHQSNTKHTSNDVYVLTHAIHKYVCLTVSSHQSNTRHIAFGVSFKLNLQSQSPWSLFNGTWQKRPSGLDYRLRFEIEEMTLQMQ